MYDRKPPPYLSDSQRGVWAQCPQKWAWKYLQTGGMEQDIHGVAGRWSSTLVHPMLAAAIQYQPTPLPPWETGPLETLYTLPVAVRLVEIYLQEQWELDLQQYTVEGVEVDTTVDIAGVPYRSIADVLLRDTETGERWVLDWKTSKYPPEGKYSLPFLQQQMGQVVAHAAVGWLVSHFQLKVGKARVGIQHTRLSVRVREDHREQWREGLLELWVHQQRSAAAGIFPRNTDSCYLFGQPCPYLPACEAGAFAEEITNRWK